jgi:hypothetical protein
MAPADDVDGAAKASPLNAKYGTRVDSQSAREMLAARLQTAAPATAAPAEKSNGHREAAGAVAAGAGAIGAFLQSRQGKQLEKEVIRGAFGLLKKSL